MTQAVRIRLDRLETLSGATGRILVVMEDIRGALTLGGVPWSEDQSVEHDTVIIIKSFAGNA